MSETPFFSIIMPLYNKQPYVKRAVNSIMRQSFHDFELIVVDDGSTDGSIFEIPDNNPKIRLFRQQNSGPSIARNRGIEEATGQYVTFIDADDYYYEFKLEQNARLLLDHPDIDWLISAFDLKSGDDSNFRGFKNLAGAPINGEPIVINNALLDLDISGIHINGLCVKKDLIWSLLKGFREDIHCFEITDIMIRCALVRPRVIVDPTPLYSVVDVPNSAFKSSENKTYGSRRMSQLYIVLNNDFRRTVKHYENKGMGMCFSHVAGLIQSKKKDMAKQYLLHSFPYKKNGEWVKYFLRCLIPAWLLNGNRN
ncbi:glycosyltransferase family 2 protein [uncultured Desulfosarcina sp.]|uniref:glycosyltransferase family 2 protein n=1 Tax=uncultured Desulfosarcina sp. TaxID=218289 RepID=UPI0029C946BF|nr:glycosyltransferase family 2 protein [uncultured Desulfosarcina sp.]